MFPGFEVCCDNHDKCYDTCNNDRDDCDAIFQDCLYKVCEEVKAVLSAEQVQVCENASGVMHAATVGLGCTSFTQAQNNACVCSGQAVDDNGDNYENGRGPKVEL